MINRKFSLLVQPAAVLIIIITISRAELFLILNRKTTDFFSKFK